MKAEIELSIDRYGKPFLKLKHHFKNDSIEQNLLGIFIENAKEGTLKLQNMPQTPSDTTHHAITVTSDKWGG